MSAAAIAPDRLVNPQVHADGEVVTIWRWMREHEPVCWHEESAYPAFWSLTRYHDVRAVYRDAARFSSEHGVMLRQRRLGADPGGRQTLALTDPPRHGQLRHVLAQLFTDRSARALEPAMQRAVGAALDRVIAEGGGDFVHDVAARVTNTVICRLMGVPDSDHEQVFAWTTEAFTHGKPLATHQFLMQYLIYLMGERMIEPADDIMSALVNCMVGDALLSDEEILLNCENLIGATENAGLSVATGMLALATFPEEWERLRHDRALVPTAVEEILRWASSATHSMRVARAAVTIRGKRIEAGDCVVLWLPSANRDEEVFDNPDRFDVGRRPNRHMAFGAGEHLCIGATLARAQARVLLTEFLERSVVIELAGPVEPLRSIAVTGPAHMPVRITGSA
jgi:cytochrome P450